MPGGTRKRALPSIQTPADSTAAQGTPWGVLTKGQQAVQAERTACAENVQDTMRNSPTGWGPRLRGCVETPQPKECSGWTGGG